MENLKKGNNVLAIQGLNRSEIGADFLISPELKITKAPDQADLATGYFLNPTPGLINNESILGFVKDTQFSVKRGFFDRAFDLEISSSTPESTIKYTTDGSTPNKNTGTTYTKPIRINKTTTLRAIAFKDGYQTTNVDTQSYLFADDILDQNSMDPDIINDDRYSNIIKDSLTNTVPVISVTVDDGDFFGPRGIYSNPELSGREAEVPISVEYFSTEISEEEFQIDAGIRIHGGNARITLKTISPLL